MNQSSVAGAITVQNTSRLGAALIIRRTKLWHISILANLLGALQIHSALILGKWMYHLPYLRDVCDFQDIN